MRQTLAVAAGAGVAAVGALILGEYELNGLVAPTAALLFGLAVAEGALLVTRQVTAPVALAAGLWAAGGMVWSSWIAAGRDWSFVPGLRWAVVPLAAVAAWWWVRSSGRRAGDSRPETARTPDG